MADLARENATLGNGGSLHDFGVMIRHIGRANISNGGFTMKTKKRIALASLAAVMLVTASLGYFSYASDVTPKYLVLQCCVDGCNGTAREANPVMTNAGTGVHIPINFIGGRCSYQWAEYTFSYTCTEGHSWNVIRRHEVNHECNQPDGYVN